MANADAGGSVQKGKFYCETVTILVENTLHRIPRNHLTEWSQAFRDMFELPQAPDAEGVSDALPINLPGCTNFEFESLLEILLTPGHLSPLELSQEQWIAGLKLSTMWDMRKIRILCIEELSSSNLTHIEMVKLGRQYKVTTWIIEGCTALVADADSLNLEGLSTLGWETAARVAWISREFAMAALSGHRTAAGIGAIPPAIWRCGNCSTTGNFQSGYCFGCRNHTSSISVRYGVRGGHHGEWRWSSRSCPSGTQANSDILSE
ncbi:hypothetical protein FA13DRAFT_1727346, partial [Coprinellus micaceus]